MHLVCVNYYVTFSNMSLAWTCTSSLPSWLTVQFPSSNTKDSHRAFILSLDICGYMFPYVHEYGLDNENSLLQSPTRLSILSPDGMDMQVYMCQLFKAMLDNPHRQREDLVPLCLGIL